MKEKGFVFQGMVTCGKVNMWGKLIENEVKEVMDGRRSCHVRSYYRSF